MTLPVLQGCGSPACKCRKPRKPRVADPQIVGAVREALDSDHVGMSRAISLVDLANKLRCHSRRVTEAVSFLQAEKYPAASVAGIGIWKYANEAERRRAIRPEASRLVKLSRKLEGMGWRREAAVVAQLALDLSTEAAA
jgi:hypothetical protein